MMRRERKRERTTERRRTVRVFEHSQPPLDKLYIGWASDHAPRRQPLCVMHAAVTSVSYFEQLGASVAELIGHILRRL